MKELLIPLGKVGEVEDVSDLSDDRAGNVNPFEDSPEMCVADTCEAGELNECYSSPLGFFLYNTPYGAGWHGREYYSSFDPLVKTQKYHSIPTVAKWETLPKCNAVSIGQRLRLLRKELGLTQEEFGQRIGKGVATIKRWESGQTKPNDKTLRLISHTFGVSYEWLKEGKGEMWQEPKDIEPSLHLSLIKDIIRELKRVEEEYEIDIPPDLFADAVEAIYEEVIKDIQKGKQDRTRLIRRGVGKIIKFAG